VKRNLFKAFLVLSIVTLVLFWSFGGRFPYPSPYAGPYEGVVLDAAMGTPIAGVLIEAIWWCHDNPLPDGPGHYQIISKSRSNENGGFQIHASDHRGGWFGTDFHLRLSAYKYIDSCYILDTNNKALPEETQEWPFVDTSIFQHLPSNLTVRMKPSMPVLLEALGSKNPLIREKAAEELKKLK
jgi:hypothetical protein